jgi:hypothetical protein
MRKEYYYSVTSPWLLESLIITLFITPHLLAESRLVAYVKEEINHLMMIFMFQKKELFQIGHLCFCGTTLHTCMYEKV